MRGETLQEEPKEKIMRTHVASEKKAATKETARRAAEKMLKEIEKELFQTI